MRSIRLAMGASALAVSVVGVCVASAAPPRPGLPTSAVLGPSAACSFGANAWQQVNRPDGAKAPVSIQSLDQSPCSYLAADATGSRWSSRDAGVHWKRVAAGGDIRRLRTERLQPRVGPKAMGPLLGSGPATGGSLPEVYSSVDGGASFEAAQVTTPQPAVEPGVNPSPAPSPGVPRGPGLAPLTMDIAAAATAVHYDGAKATPFVYLAGRANTETLGPSAAGNAATLLKSTDGGRTFGSVTAPERLTPTAVAVNPTSPDEIWVNDRQNGAPGGGAWMSTDGGQTFSLACCAGATVNDIAITPGSDGSIDVLLATDQGLMRSLDDGQTWTNLSTTSTTGIRTPPDDASTFLVQTGDGIEMSTGPKIKWTAVPGLPDGCGPTNLRVNDQVPPTFMVDCAKLGGTYRLLLTNYAGFGGPQGGGGSVFSLGCPLYTECQALDNGRKLQTLATWNLPGSNTASGSIAFDGTLLYYDMNTPGHIGRVRASDGTFVGAIATHLDIFSMTFDLTHDHLLISTPTGDLDALDVRTQRVTRLSFTPYKVPSYDSGSDGLTWVPEIGFALFRRGLTNDGPGERVCNIVLPGNTQSTSTFVAAGDGGGYIQDEDDQSIIRIDSTCHVTGLYAHRQFSESGAENDAMACDTQTYFPQPAIWIRDSEPSTVTSYGVPFGYCPMPSALTVSAPPKVMHGSTALICAQLRNATNHHPGANRGITITVEGVVVGHGQTDADGRACVVDRAPAVVAGTLPLTVRASFLGDSALFPSRAQTVMSVLGDQPAPPIHPPRIALVVPPPPPPPPVHPPVNSPVQGPAPNPAQAPQGQTQPQSTQVMQGVVVPQRQQQPQLALARAASELQAEPGNAMVAPKPRRPLPLDPAGVAGLLAIGCAVTAGTARALAPARASRRQRRR